MKYTVLIEESEEGFAVSVPGLPGCHSQGDTEAEALANIADAIREYLEVVQEMTRSASPVSRAAPNQFGNQQGEPMAAKVKPIPDGYHTPTPSLIVRGPAAATDFYKK